MYRSLFSINKHIATNKFTTRLPVNIFNIVHNFATATTKRSTNKFSNNNNKMSCSIPSVMRGVRVHNTGDASVLKYETDIPVPTSIKSNEILVHVDYSGINYIDTYQRSGLYKLPLPFVAGREGAGTIVSVGSSVNEFKVGDTVAFFAQGSYGEYCAVDINSAYKLDKSITTQQAAAAFLQGLTAHYLATSSYNIKSGDYVLIHAAAGGTGQLLTQIAKLKGAKVIATCGSEEKAKIVKDCGGDHIINYSETKEWVSEVMKITNNKGCMGVYDGVGLSTYQQSMKCVAKCGTLVLFGNASGAVPPINPFDLMNQGSIFLIRPTLKDYIATKQDLDSRSNELFQWIQSGKVKLNIAKTFKLNEAADAHRALESRQLAGKLLIDINP